MTKPLVLGLSGSLRRNSANTAILRTLADVFADKLDLRIHSLSDIPMYNADEDGDHAPQSVSLLKSAISHASGIIVASPEYNFGMPGMLKNAIDWASRPGYASVLKGKPVTIVTSSPAATGGVRAQAQIRATLTATLSRVVPHPEIVIPAVYQKIVDGRLVDEPTLAFMNAAIESLLEEITALANRFDAHAFPDNA